MSKESEEHKENVSEQAEEETQDPVDELLEMVDQKKEELAEKREEENPENRLTGYTLLNHFVAITGKNPFTGQRQTQGIGDRRYPESDMFSTKLNKNLKEIRENITVLNSVLPNMDEEEAKEFDEYLDKRDEVVKKNCGVDNPDQYSEEELLALANRKNNKEIYEREMAELKEQYQEVIDRNDEVSERRDEIMKKPLLKCNFDLITENDARGTDLSQKELDSIGAMLDF